MNFKLTAILAAAVLCAASASSCGKDKSSSSEVILDIKTTEASTEPTSEAEETTTTTDKKDDKKTTTTTAEKSETVTTTASDPEPATADPEPVPDAYSEPEVPDNSSSAPEPVAETPTEAPKPKTISFSTSNIDQPISTFTSALGNSFMQREAEACIPKGDAGDKLFVYEYSDIMFECYSSGGTHYVYDIVIKGGSHATDKGIKVGSSRADVTAAYGSLDDFNGDLIYSGGSGEIYFVMSGDTVSEIQINS